MKKIRNIAVVLAVCAVIAFVPKAEAWGPTYVSISPLSVVLQKGEFIEGSVSSVDGIKKLTIYVNGKAYKPKLTIGSLGERNLNGKWSARIAPSKKGVYRITAVAVPRKGKPIVTKEYVSTVVGKTPVRYGNPY